MPSPRSSRRRAACFGLLGAALIVGGCADYLNHRDSITLAAGDAIHFNQAVHTIEHLPPEAYKTDIDANGKRTARVIGPYFLPPPPPQPVVNVTINQ